MVDNSFDSHVINNKYVIGSVIDKGAFGILYNGMNKKNCENVAIKLEKKLSLSTIKNEANILKYLQEQKCYYVPVLYWYGIYQDYFTIIMPLYDCNLYEYTINNTVMSDDLCTIALKVLSIIEHIHSVFVLHRDIKPQHFMLRNNDIYLVDFGLSVFYVDENKRHIRNESNDSIIGSQNYASYFIHEGSRYSRRDDLISLSYVFIFLANKTLPWSDVVSKNIIDQHQEPTDIMHHKNQMIKDLKSIDSLIMNMKNSFTFISDYISSCYQLNYYDTPKYITYLAMFHW